MNNHYPNLSYVIVSTDPSNFLFPLSDLNKLREVFSSNILTKNDSPVFATDIYGSVVFFRASDIQFITVSTPEVRHNALELELQELIETHTKKKELKELYYNSLEELDLLPKPFE